MNQFAMKNMDQHSTAKDQQANQRNGKQDQGNKNEKHDDEHMSKMYVIQNQQNQGNGGLNYSGSIDESVAEESIHSNKMDKDWNNQLLDNIDDQHDNESGKTDMVDDGTMNVFGFNDDLNLDDRLII